jgi:hypothetical protein
MIFTLCIHFSLTASEGLAVVYYIVLASAAKSAILQHLSIIRYIKSRAIINKNADNKPGL